MSGRRLAGYFLGRRDYRSVLGLQERLHAERVSGAVGDTVLFVEHPAVITLGRGAHAENLLASAKRLSELGVDVVETGRGGDVTLHAPGQLVCYPIVDLSPDRKDVRRYVRRLHWSRSSCARSPLVPRAVCTSGEAGDRSYPLKYMNSTRANMASDSSASPAIPSQDRSVRSNRGNGGAPPGATSPQRGHLPSV